MHPPISVDRRCILSAAAGAFLPLAARAQMAAEPAGLLVASPPGARLDRWAEPIAAGVGRALPSRTPLIRHNLGGLDGVTGANRFEARAEPDGTKALLVPGSATLSWLVGETRAKFDPSHWLLLWATTAPAVLVSRVLPRPGTTMQIATTTPAGPELPVLLALDVAGVQVGLTSPQEADAMLLQGKGLLAAVQAASAQGMQPVLTLGQIGEGGQIGRDPMFPAVPTLQDLTRDRIPLRLAAALLASSAAAQLDAGLVLPQLTPADAVATWRRASQSLARDPDLLSEAGRLGSRMLPATEAAELVHHIAGDPGVLLSLRQWLADRFGWRAA